MQSILNNCLLVFAVFIGFVGSAQAQAPVRAQLIGAFNERMNPDVKVSGPVVVGVSSKAVFDGSALKFLAIYPTDDLETVCLTVESHDGVYTSRNEFHLENSVSGHPVLLPYDSSQYIKKLASEYTDRTLALKAVPYPCAHVENAAKVLPLQRVDHLNADALRFYINAQTATDIFISSKQTEGLCHPVQGRHTNFDHICEIDLPTASKGTAADVRIRIDRERFGRELPAAEVIVMRRTAVQ